MEKKTNTYRVLQYTVENEPGMNDIVVFGRCTASFLGQFRTNIDITNMTNDEIDDLVSSNMKG